jgi:hypothetical protein
MWRLATRSGEGSDREAGYFKILGAEWKYGLRIKNDEDVCDPSNS